MIESPAMATTIRAMQAARLLRGIPLVGNPRVAEITPMAPDFPDKGLDPIIEQEQRPKQTRADWRRQMNGRR